MHNYFKEWESLYIQHKSLLISFAFRMTGSLSDAKDIVQETFMAVSKVDPSQIQNHKGWLMKVCSNKGLDHLKRAYKKREVYPGTWLPDEIPDSLQTLHQSMEHETPEKKVILSESLTTSFLLLIERLTPEQRIIYILREVFDYSFKEIAGFLNKSEGALRKIAQRAREAVLSGKTKFTEPPSNAKELLAQFFALAKEGNVQGMTNMLSPESQLWGDGGGKVHAAGFIEDMEKIRAFFAQLVNSDAFSSKEYKIEFHHVNFRPGVVFSKKTDSGWVFDTIISYEFIGDKIVRMYAQRNPDKLKRLIIGSRDPF